MSTIPAGTRSSKPLRLSSAWIHLVTPLSHKIARPLAEGLRNRVVCRDDDAARLMPQPLLDVREAINEAIGASELETVWSDAGPIPGEQGVEQERDLGDALGRTLDGWLAYAVLAARLADVEASERSVPWRLWRRTTPHCQS